MTGRRRGGWLGGRVLGCWLLAAVLLAAGCGGGSNHAASLASTTSSSTSGTTTTVLTPNPPGVGIHKIQHVVVIMQ